MLILFETPAGYALFSAKDSKLAKAKPEDIFQHFASPQAASEL